MLTKTARVTLLGVLGVILFMVVVYLVVINIRHQIKITSIGVETVVVSERSIKVNGVLFSSGERYRGYKHEVKGNDVFIKVYTSYVSGVWPGGDVNISIDGDFKDTKNVYLLDDTDKKLIWTK